MPKNIIFYFSGTGNSLKSAKDIAAQIGDCDLVLMNKPYALYGKYERIGFVYPVYCVGLPAAVERFIEALNISENKQSYFFSVCTFGGMSGGLARIDELLQAGGAKLSYGAGIKCFANYICLYGMASKKPYARNVAQMGVGLYMLVFLGVIMGENMV